MVVRAGQRLRSANIYRGKKEKSDMAAVMTERLIYEILSAVEEIPEGRVATYGQIARLIGRDKNARLVGKVLSRAEYYGKYPCHRVVNHAGRLAPHFPEQRHLLEDEGVKFRDETHVDMKKYQWDGT
jgi:methylated-DNA-protein-cysteine methyltransferase-like protein